MALRSLAPSCASSFASTFALACTFEVVLAFASFSVLALAWWGVPCVVEGPAVVGVVGGTIVVAVATEFASYDTRCESKTSSQFSFYVFEIYTKPT